jgi:hemerythrin-like domain-containing protein
MKRDSALASLSRDHHQALFVAQVLRRATAETAGEARAAFLTYWEQHGRAHFRLEEEVLLPGYAEHGDSHHPLVARVLCDHVEIRHRANGLVHEDPAAVDALHRLGLRLGEHVRLEERELFPLIESALPADRLAALAVEMDRAEQALAH